MGNWKRRLLLLFMALTVWGNAPATGSGGNIFEELTPEEIAGEHYFELLDEQGKLITVTGHRLRPGDRYLASDNRLYEVSMVEKYIARARFRELVVLKSPPQASGLTAPVFPVQGSRPAHIIAIYHTHSAECYVPSDGTDSVEGHGGIYAVGEAFRDALAAKGIKVLYSWHTHLPHDRGAYRRSRVTAESLLRHHPDAIFDIHRDAAPPEAYSLQMGNEWLTQIQIVIGQDNPTEQVNQSYAFDLKGYSDCIYPGLVKGVLITSGDFNQDLSPMSLLLEVGAHTNTKEAAVDGITYFADVVAYYFYGPEYLPETPPKELKSKAPALYRDAGGISKAVSGTVLGLLIAGLGISLGFYVVNEPKAFPRMISFWKKLPERAKRWIGGGKKWVRNFPDMAAQSLKEYPGNLEDSWQCLKHEGRQLVGYALLELAKMKETSRGWPKYRTILRNNWGESRDEFRKQWDCTKNMFKQIWVRLQHRD